MPGKVKVKILAGRNLPVMDRSSDTTDAYVEIKLGNTTYKTDVCRKSLNPQWNSEWYKFEMDDAELQDEPLQVRLMDHDTYSANDAIGKVYLNLNPLLLPPSLPGPDVGPLSNPISGGSTMSGWFPVYDTMHGIRGEVNIIVKVELFSDFNKFRQSSCGVQFFCSTGVPHGFETHVIHGMVEELVVSDDPEYQWIDKIRTPRASNEARQLLFLKLSGEVQRKIGLKVLDLGGNAVLGYKQCFDLEGESGIVVRGLGTAVTLSKLQSYIIQPTLLSHTSMPVDDTIDSVCVEASTGFGKNNLSQSHVIPSCINFPSSSLQMDNHITSYNRNSSPRTHGHQHVKKKFKRSTRSLNDDLSLGDNVSIKSLLEQEDMRGEVTSGTKKFFRAISAFPRSKIKRFQISKQKSCDGSVFRGKRFQQKKPKSDSVTVCLIKSIIESDALLDRVSETDETADPYYEEPEMRYVDGHLEPLDDSSSSSDSSSEIEDVSDISSLNMISMGSVKSKSDDESMLEIESISTCSKNSYPFKVRQDSSCSKSVESEIYLEKKRHDTESSSDTYTLLDHAIDNDKLISSKREKSPLYSLKNDVLERKGFRSDTPPMSDMDLFLIKDSRIIFQETIFSPNAPVKLIVTEPSVERNYDNSPEDFSTKFKDSSVGEDRSITGYNFSSEKNNLQEAEKANIELLNSIDIDTTLTSKEINCSKSIVCKEHESLEDKPESKLSPQSTSEPSSQFENFPVDPASKSEKLCGTNTVSQLYDTKNVNDVSKINPFVFPNPLNVELINSSDDSVPKLKNNHDKISNLPFISSRTTNSFDCEKNTSNAKITTEKTPETVFGNPILIHAPCDNKEDFKQFKSSTNLEPVSLLVKSHSDSGLAFNAPETCSVLTPEVPSSRPIQQEESQIIAASLRPGSQAAGQSQLPVTTVKSSQSPAKLNPIPGMHRRSSDSDLSITPKGFTRKRNSLTGSDRSSGAGGSRGGFHSAFPRSAMFKENLDMLEYPFVTMSKFPPGFILHIGGVVTARSVKLLERMTNLAEPESRDSWWTDVRMEVRSHARSLGCNVILNYSENTTICDDVCVLSACGTAAVISLRGDLNLLSGTTFTEPLEQLAGVPVLSKHVNTVNSSTVVPSSLVPEIDPKPLSTTPQSTAQKHDIGGGAAVSCVGAIRGRNFNTRQRHSSESQDLGDIVTLPCSFCHIPYNHKTAPFHLNVYRCCVCRKKMVPDILLATIEPPDGLPLTGRGCFLQAFECRPKKDNRGELNAKEISDGLPFLEFEVHKQLLNKLHVNGMNAIFGLKVQICIGEKTVAAHATGTGFLLTPLPVPPVPSVAPNNTWKGDARVSQVQQLLFDTVRKNREFYQLRPPTMIAQEFLETNGRESGGDRGDGSDSDESDDDLAELDPHTDSKESFVLVVDDIQDVDQIPHLIDPHPPDGFHVVTIESLPGVDDLEIVTNLQMFTQIWRSRLPSNQPPACVNKNFHRVLQGLYYKLRRMTPCAFGALRFKIDLPEQDELQISVVGMAVGLAESDHNSCKKEGKRKLPSTSKDVSKKQDEGDMIFSLEEDNCETTASNESNSGIVNSNQNGLVTVTTSAATNINSLNKTAQPHSPLRPSRRSFHTPPKERYGVDVTPLSYVPGGRIEKYLGNLNFFFIRESTCIRESGGLSGFVHSFVNEVLAIVRAHVTALGGNAMIAYFMTDCVLLNNPHKNHGQCLVNVGGDAVFVSYYHED